MQIGVAMKPFVQAHRGASSYAPENTLEAFELAVKMGADGVELDTHLSKDGVIMVCHDDRVDRCSDGKGRICDMTCSELKQLDFSYKFPEYKGAKMPTLAEVYDLLKPTNLFINIEIKSLPILYPGIEEKLNALADSMDMQDRIMYSSFNHYSLKKMRDINPDVPLGILYNDAPYEPWKYAKALGFTALHPHMASLQYPVVSNAQAAGIKVHPWTVDSEEDIMWMYRLGVDAVISNRPDVAIRLRDGEMR